MLSVAWEDLGEGKVACYQSSQTPLYRHPLNTDTSLSRTVCLVSVKTSHTFSLNSTPLIQTPRRRFLWPPQCRPVSTGFDCISLHAWSKSPLSFHPFLKNGIHDKIYSVVNSDQAWLFIVALCYLFCIKKLPSNPVNTDTEGAIESVHINGVSGGVELRESGIEAESWIMNHSYKTFNNHESLF